MSGNIQFKYTQKVTDNQIHPDQKIKHFII